ncbi:carbohydrate ABC transporter permease [Paenibacillus aceti]|uniref:Sugar ABC transporter permease n=1 Tax=Paenibacillus aceti TaxID=1820010 RepID=A0ABQ1VTJ7_9BACL|nr:sugar ABC transporter permease [Paenibacillus aceti]GGF93555.1 sugar ABC transporter permease [Paenibacillus aceti]
MNAEHASRKSTGISGNSPRPHRGLSTFKRQDYTWAYLMIAPTVIGLLIFYVWPVFQTIFFSFTEWGDFGKYHWSGVDNYKNMIQDREVLMAFRNTFVYTLLVVPVSIALSTIIAVMLNQKIKGQSVYRTLYFLPVVTMPAAIGMVWKWLYNTEYGLINYLLSLLSINKIAFVTDANIALYSIIVVAIWSSLGTNIVILLSGLQGISSSYYEAAEMDGAGPLVRFFYITLPLLTPTLFFVTIMGLIAAFQVFDLLFIIVQNASPSVLESTQSVVYLFYKYAFVTNNKGYAAAIAVTMFVVILIITSVQMKLQKKWVHY